MVDIKEIIRVLGFIQEYFDNHADEQESDCREELFSDWSEITLDAITLLKAQEPHVSHKAAQKYRAETQKATAQNDEVKQMIEEINRRTRIPFHPDI